MAGSITVSSITLDSDNNFSIKSNTGATLFFANTTGIDIANSIGATAITNDKILSVANTKISGNIASSQIAPNQTLNGNVSITGTLAVSGAVTLTTALPVLSGGTGVTTSTGTGSVVLSASPTFTGNVTTPLSYVRLNTANGYGSTNTKIRRFTNIVNNVGTDITYADSATLGGTFTINTNGVYSVSYGDNFNAGTWFGVTINSASLTTTISTLPAAEILVLSYIAAGEGRPGSSTFYAAASAVVRAHTDGAASGTQTNAQQFTIARVQ
jgi:hypothetical protein